MDFHATRWQRWLVASDDDTRIVGNATFLQSGEFAPKFGMDQNGLLQDRAKRRKYGLTPELRPAKLEDRSAQARNLLGNAPWVRSEITVSTIARQVPVAPGRKIADTTANGRRSARFVSARHTASDATIASTSDATSARFESPPVSA